MDPDKVVEELTAEQEAARKEEELKVKAGSVLRLLMRSNGFIHVSKAKEKDKGWASASFGGGSVGVNLEIVQLLIDGGCLAEITGDQLCQTYIVNSDFAESLERPETLTAVSRERDAI